MAWKKRGERKGAKRLPEKLRQEVISRDRKRGRGCFFDFPGCLGINQPDVQVHHIVEAADYEDPNDPMIDDITLLITACTPCHTRHSAQASARRAWDWQRKPEKHPQLPD